MTDQSQQSLGMDDKKNIDSVENYEFEPIKGYPRLNWKGKRQFASTQYYPAQIKEVFGEPVDNWRNKIYWGDNLQVMSHLLKEFRGQVNLVYIDPPFDSKADYKKKIDLKGTKLNSDRTAFEEKQYTDLWNNDEYLQFMFERLVLIRELLAKDGSIWLHCDWRKSHHLRMIMDDVFGYENFRAHVIWRTMTSSGYKGKSSLGRSHADLLYYSKGHDFTYNPIATGVSNKMIDRYVHKDPDGRYFKDSYLGDVTPETVEDLRGKNLLYTTTTGGYRIKHYLDEAIGTLVDDIWNDIDVENSQSKIQTGYPTQKPQALLERIINLTSNDGDLVMDCFMGSGTTQSAAMRLGRRFIGADINLGSIQVTTKRLVIIQKELEQTINQPSLIDQDNLKVYKGFEVYNVNHYDIFRNPIEAKELLLDALEVQKFDQGNLFDGEKDGRMVKIMPVNRIATRADLSELISGFDYKTFQKRQEQNPGKPVEKISLVCMGHEPDLSAFLENEVKPLKIDVEVVDILRDKQNLQFKRDSEAKIIIKNETLVIEKFYPMNLLQKLSLQKEKVDDWHELVESVMVDWNYDGAILEPATVDIPESNELVKGKYKIPAGAGTIRVKITDLLSESLEVEVQYA